MKPKMPAGRYVVAVSGGVDSMTLLHMLVQKRHRKTKNNVQLVVAHFNHGIREGSAKDEKLVAGVARKHNLPLEIERAKLGKNASEEKARVARYKFLYKVKTKHGARAIITAHHQDDLIETAFINLLRGTGRRGLTALAQNPDVIRPLLDTPKKELIKYAKAHKLEWLEDKTNKDPAYLRNYIRLKLISKLTQSQREQLVANIQRLNRINPLLDHEIAILSQSIGQNGQIDRQRFINLPTEIAAEVLAFKLRQAQIRQFDKKMLERLSIAIKTAKAGTKHDVIKGVKMEISREFALLMTGVN